jgi:hypothetical protein
MAGNVRRPAAIASAIVVIAAAAAGWAGAAQAATAPGWHLSDVYPVNSSIAAITAATLGNAWATESCTKTCRSGSDGLTIRHWNDVQWQGVADPAVFAHLGGSTPLITMPPGANSDPWVLDGSVAVHWTGKAWAAPDRFAGDIGLSAAVAPSASAVWALGQTTAGKPVAERYNGKAWSALPAPPITPSELSATTTASVWAIGAAAGGVPNSLTYPMVASHWIGGKWATTKLPSINLYDGSELMSASIVSEGAHAAWAFGQISGEDVPGDPTGIELFRWNGASWLSVPVPYQTLGQASGISSDGHGGIWFSAADEDGHDYLVHDSSAGQWSEQVIPMPVGATAATVNAVEPIPGTSSLWGGGAADVPAGTQGMILSYP